MNLAPRVLTYLRFDVLHGFSLLIPILLCSHAVQNVNTLPIDQLLKSNFIFII